MLSESDKDLGNEVILAQLLAYNDLPAIKEKGIKTIKLIILQCIEVTLLLSYQSY